MDISTKGLIIKEQNVGESDRLITILTEDEGIIRAFVKRANTIKNKNLSSTGLMTLSRFLLYKGRDKYIVKEAFAVEVFFELRKNIELLSLAQYFCEIILSLNITPDDAKEVLSLALNSIYLLCKGTIDKDIIKSVFELKAISIVGFMPDLVCCNVCGCYECDKMYFSLSNNVIYCDKCYNESKGYAILLSSSALKAMRHILYSPKKELFNFNVSGQSKKILNFTTETYVKSVVNQEFKALDFYKSILNQGDTI